MKRWETEAETIPFFRLIRRISWQCSRSISVITDVTDYLCSIFELSGYWPIETRIGESGSKETQTVAGLRTRSLDVWEKSVKIGRDSVISQSIKMKTATCMNDYCQSTAEHCTWLRISPKFYCICIEYNIFTNVGFEMHLKIEKELKVNCCWHFSC